MKVDTEVNANPYQPLVTARPRFESSEEPSILPNGVGEAMDSRMQLSPGSPSDALEHWHTKTPEERQLHRKQKKRKAKERELVEQIQAVEEVFNRRLQPLKAELDAIRVELARDAHEIDRIKFANAELPPGPRSLRWVEGDMFTLACMVVIISNFAVMLLEVRDKNNDQLVHDYWILNHCFLVWYLVELLLKMVLHQNKFLFGPLTSDRAFRWVDVVIVISGVAEQWILPLCLATGDAGLPFNPAALRVLRILRITRMFRLLKAVYLMMLMDTSWVEGRRFEMFTTFVIVLNSITMGLELDVDWVGFPYLNNAFLTIYTFEVLMKIKNHRMAYFTDTPSSYWNCLDFVIVSGGIVETLALPAYEGMVSFMYNQPAVNTFPSGVLSLLRIFRLLRVLRLYRLLTSVKALRKLVFGIANAMQGTMWVIILTFLILYIFAIVFTTLVGRGIVVDPDDHREAIEAFGSVELSAYMLFKLMNDDQSVVAFTDSVWVKLLFMLAMVMLNWVMLATLTSVVTDHMNSSTHEQEKKEEEQQEINRRQRSERILLNLFKQMDTDGSGFIDDVEFGKMLANENLRAELSEASGLRSTDLVELFNYLSHHKEGSDTRIILYENFVTKLRQEGKPASERTVFRLEEELRALEKRMELRFNNLFRVMTIPVDNRGGMQSELYVPLPGPEMSWWQKKSKEIGLKNEGRGSLGSLDEDQTDRRMATGGSEESLSPNSVDGDDVDRKDPQFLDLLQGDTTVSDVGTAKDLRNGESATSAAGNQTV